MSRTPEGVKLFIGQIPKDYTDKDVRNLFEPYGEIHSFNMLEDKSTGQHKGCAFLTYFSNESSKRAQEQLHGKQTLPGARNPLQVKPAAAEISPENRKLFCGMLSRSLDEEGVRGIFSQFGTIEDVTVLRANGVSKGCAFVLFETRQQAQNAIRAMHHSQTMEGCTSPMVVKLADSEKDKHAKNAMKGNSGASMMGSAASFQAADVTGQVSALQQQAVYYQQLFNQLVLPQIMAGNLPPPGSPGAVSALVNAMAAQAKSLDQQQSLAGSLVASGAGLAGAYATPYAANTAAFQYGGIQQQSNAGPINTKQEEGPEGANLFIYQIPNDYSDTDLMQLFTPFGAVVSSKVFVDKVTGQSKGFGFVSYQDPSSANDAIASMNNFVVGNKRLRVTLKKKKESKPY